LAFLVIETTNYQTLMVHLDPSSSSLKPSATPEHIKRRTHLDSGNTQSCSSALPENSSAAKL
jgi:hypothetical protein